MNNLKLSKINIINFTIIIIWITFLWLYWITYTRLMYFLTILEFILIYRIIINKLENSNQYKINNNKILNLIIIVNKYRNPVLLLLVKWDLGIYDLIIYYNNKILNFIIYILFILIINPVKIFYYKFYKILGIWKERKLKNIILNRMLGTIMSVLIFANIIMYIKHTYDLNILMIVYIYCLIISLLCEVIETRENKWLNIFLLNHISTKSIMLNRQEVNLLSIILKKNNIDKLDLSLQDNQYKLDKFIVGYTYYIIDSLKYFESKPNYWTYFELRSCVEHIYLMSRIDEYIFLKYYEWNVPNIELIKYFNIKDLSKLKKIYEYDYKVFKVLLFLYWDLEYYLDNYDNVKNSLFVDTSDVAFLRIKFNTEFKSELQFLEKIKYKDTKKFWINFESTYYFLLKYDLLNKNWKHLINKITNINSEDRKNLSIYNKYNDLVTQSDISLLREVQAVEDPINPLYYEKYKEEWYKEWCSELNADLTLKYKSKIKELELELTILLEWVEI